MDHHPTTTSGFLDGPLTQLYFSWRPLHLRRAEIYERLGDNAQAVEHYTRFLDLWKDADPELQPTVRDVKQRLAKLVEER